MKQHTQRTHVGVWLDNAKAIIIANDIENEQEDYAVAEQVKAKGSFGGGSEHSMNNAKQSDLLKYFKSVSGLLTGYDEILIFGPGKSQEQFQHHLQQDAQFNNKQITIESADQLTDPQMIAMVRDFFKSHQS
jgi:stalled ribosome rescue protein Dom34